MQIIQEQLTLARPRLTSPILVNRLMVCSLSPNQIAALPDIFSSLVPRCRCYLCLDRLSDLEEHHFWYLNGCSVCPPVVGFISAHLGLPSSGVAGILLTHLGDNGQTSRMYPPSVESRLADPMYPTAAALSSSLVASAISDVIGAPSGTTKKRAVPF